MFYQYDIDNDGGTWAKSGSTDCQCNIYTKTPQINTEHNCVYYAPNNLRGDAGVVQGPTTSECSEECELLSSEGRCEKKSLNDIKLYTYSKYTGSAITEDCTVVAGSANEEATAATTCTLTAGDPSAGSPGSCAVVTGSGSCNYVAPASGTSENTGTCTAKFNDASGYVLTADTYIRNQSICEGKNTQSVCELSPNICEFNINNGNIWKNKETGDQELQFTSESRPAYNCKLKEDRNPALSQTQYIALDMCVSKQYPECKNQDGTECGIYGIDLLDEGMCPAPCIYTKNNYEKICKETPVISGCNGLCQDPQLPPSAVRGGVDAAGEPIILLNTRVHDDNDPNLNKKSLFYETKKCLSSDDCNNVGFCYSSLPENIVHCNGYDNDAAGCTGDTEKSCYWESDICEQVASYAPASTDYRAQSGTDQTGTAASPGYTVATCIERSFDGSTVPADASACAQVTGAELIDSSLCDAVMTANDATVTACTYQPQVGTPASVDYSAATPNFQPLVGTAQIGTRNYSVPEICCPIDHIKYNNLQDSSFDFDSGKSNYCIPIPGTLHQELTEKTSCLDYNLQTDTCAKENGSGKCKKYSLDKENGKCQNLCSEEISDPYNIYMTKTELMERRSKWQKLISPTEDILETCSCPAPFAYRRTNDDKHFYCEVQNDENIALNLCKNWNSASIQLQGTDEDIAYTGRFGQYFTRPAGVSSAEWYTRGESEYEAEVVEGAPAVAASPAEPTLPDVVASPDVVDIGPVIEGFWELAQDNTSCTETCSAVNGSCIGGNWGANDSTTLNAAAAEAAQGKAVLAAVRAAAEARSPGSGASVYDETCRATTAGIDDAACSGVTLDGTEATCTSAGACKYTAAPTVFNEDGSDLCSKGSSPTEIDSAPQVDRAGGTCLYNTSVSSCTQTSPSLSLCKCV